MSEEEHRNITKKDLVHSLGKGALGAIPVIGSLASEIFGLVVTPPLERRRAEFVNDLAQRLKDLEESGRVKIDELGENDLFIDVVLQATTLALKTSETEKINSFKNAVINTVKTEMLDQTKTQIFLNQLDQFTTWHIRILKLIDNPKRWFEEAQQVAPNYMMGSIFSMLKEAYPELSSKDALVEIIWNDLATAGFHRSGSIKSTMSGDGVLANRTTELGQEFLEFIMTS